MMHTGNEGLRMIVYRKQYRLRSTFYKQRKIIQRDTCPLKNSPGFYFIQPPRINSLYNPAIQTVLY